jgi:serine/threonine protein kinase
MQIQTEYHGYFLKECIKQHEYGSVYRGQANEGTGPDFVIKIFNAQPLSMRERQRFLYEMNLLTSLQHPALLPLLEAGIDKGKPYLIRAYAPEGSLITQLFQQDGGTFPLPTVIDILTRIGAAVTYLHQKQISHGGIKPENILFDVDQKAFLADIHLASLYSSTPPITPQLAITTEEGEQPTTAQDDKKRDMQDDIYALSTLAYELLTGYQPFASINVHNAAPVPPSHWTPSLSKDVDLVFSQALSPRSEERFSSATLFVKALQRALNLSSQDDEVKQVSTSLLQTSVKQLVLFQPQTEVRQAEATRFIGQQPSHNRPFFKKQTSIFSIKWPLIVLAVVLLLTSILVPVFLFHLPSNPTATSMHKAQNQSPTQRTNSIAPNHVALKPTPVKHQEPTPKPTPIPTSTPTPNPTPPPPMPAIVNAGFEFPNLNGDYEYAPDNSGWTFSNDCGIAGNGSDLTANTSNAPWGVQVAFIQARGTMSQNVSFAQGTYRISFLAVQRADSSSAQSLWVLIDNTVVGAFTPVGGNYLYYTTPSFTVSPGIHTLQFRGLKGGAHNTVFVDSVTVIN